MKDNLLNNLRKHTERQHVRVLALAVLFISTALLLWNAAGMYAQRLQTLSVLPTHGEIAEEILSTSRSEPKTLQIESIDVAVSFEEPVDLAEDGTLDVPDAYDTVAWYKQSPTPGELGPSVILGHVDSYEGPAVFYSLGQVQVGDPIRIERVDGSAVTFEVSGYERVEQNEFPTERVYGAIPNAQIRLITCTGIYNKGVRRYSHNLIVYGTLVAIEESSGAAQRTENRE